MDDISKLKAVFARAMDVDVSTVNDDSSSETIEGWTSVNHLLAINEIENEFSIQLTMDETMNITTFGDLIAVVKRKLRK